MDNTQQKARGFNLSPISKLQFLGLSLETLFGGRFPPLCRIFQAQSESRDFISRK
jgi:hypothetical protein